MYNIALEGVSRYGLSQAVTAIIRGALGHTFFPSPVELRQQCELAEAPIRRQAEREAVRAAWAYENAVYEQTRAQRTPEAVALQQAAYRRFCEGYEDSKSIAQERVYLDPELLAKVPDASSTFKKSEVA